MTTVATNNDDFEDKKPKKRNYKNIIPTQKSKIKNKNHSSINKSKKPIPEPEKNSSIDSANIYPQNKNNITDTDIEAFLSEMKNQINEDDIKRANRLKQIKSYEPIRLMLEEYFDGFLLVGYDVYGNRVAIKQAKNDKQEDALIEQFRNIIFRMMS